MCSPTRRANSQTARSSAPRSRARWSRDPKILLLDDPLRNVDAKLRYEMRLELPPLLKNSGATALYVTQDYKEAMAIGDRIAVLIDGGFAQVAAPAEIYREPATIGVARLFGDPSINLVPVEPLIRHEGLTVHFAGCVLPIPMSYEEAAGRACMMGLRPEAYHGRRGAVAATHSLSMLPQSLRSTKRRSCSCAPMTDTSSSPRKRARMRSRGVTAPRMRGSIRNAVLLFDAESGDRIPPRQR